MAPDEPSETPARKVAREASKILEAPRPAPFQTLARGALVVLLLYLIFGVLIPQYADYDEVWDAITSLSALGLILMVALTLTIELAKSASPSLLIAGLGLRQAFLAQESAAVVSNTIPGPSGTIAKYATYRRYGIELVDFGRGTVMNSAWSNIIPLILPSVAMLLLATQDTIPGRVLGLTLVALGLSIAAILVGIGIVRSRRFARWIGEWIGRAVNWLRGLVNRPPSQTVGEAVVRFRLDVLATVRDRGVVLTLIVVGKEVSTFLALLVAIRSLDVGRVDLTAIEVFASYTLVRLLTLVEITPGNIGVAETLYISTLSWATQSTSDDVIVAAVFVFRMFTYLGPIVLGGGCWLWLRHYFRRTGVGDGHTRATG